MAVYYINGISNSGATFGTSGYYYPLYLTAAEANSAVDNTLGTSHPHTFEEAPNITFYMPVEDAQHAQATAPSGSYSSEVYVSYTSPIAEEDVEEIGFGVLAGDTFNSWRKKTNDVARETIANKAAISSVDTRLTRLLSVTGGENNIMTLTSSDNITGEKEFEGIVKFSAADDSTNAIQVGANGKIYVEASSFKFTKSIDLHTAGAEIKASDFDVPTGRTKYAGVQYTWPSQAPAPGQILKSGSGNTLNWATETAAEANVEAFVIEDPNPIGSIYQWTLTNPPSKWLLCDGSDVYRVPTDVDGVTQPGYPDLFGVIGKTYNLSTDTGADFTGETPVKFRLPNLQGRVPIGVGTNTDAIGTQAQFTLGQTNAVVDGVTLSGGEYQNDITHTITIDEMPQHTHDTPYGMLTGNYQGPQQNENAGGYDGGGNFHLGISALARTTTSAGSSDPLSITTQNIQPFIALTYIIKAEGSTIVTQNVTPSDGILINDEAAQTNLLAAGSVNTIKMDADSNDFEFSGNSLKLKEEPTSLGTSRFFGKADFVSSFTQVVSTDTEFTIVHDLGTQDLHYIMQLKFPGGEVMQLNPMLTYPYFNKMKPQGISVIITDTEFKCKSGKGLAFFRTQDGEQLGVGTDDDLDGHDTTTAGNVDDNDDREGILFRIIAYKF